MNIFGSTVSSSGSWCILIAIGTRTIGFNKLLMSSPNITAHYFPSLFLLILEYPLAEEVDLRVFTAEGLLIATTPFTYYELQQHNSDIMLQLLSQHLQSYFPPVLGQGTGGAGMASGAQVCTPIFPPV